MLDLDDNVPLAKGNILYLGKKLKQVLFFLKIIMLDILSIKYILTNDIWVS